MKKVIGIVGGIGPESSADFYKKLIKETQKRKLINENTDYPHIILDSIPAPELVNHSDLTLYKESVKRLENAGADFITIVCNTAHIYFEELQKSVNVPIINLKEITKNFLKNKNINNLLILGSKPLINSGLFEFGEINTIKLSEKEKDDMNQIILDYNIGKDSKRQKEKIEYLMEKYKPNFILIACTELSSLLSSTKMKKIDTIDILLEATLDKWQSGFR